MSDGHLARFRDAVAPERPRINLAEAALLCAQDVYPDLDVAGTMAEIDALGTTLARRLPADFSVTHRIIALNNYLFRELGFSGNVESYYDPRNSFLNDVLARRTGIPITLSILYMAVGERLGLKLKGVSFPGHFLVKVRVNGGELVLDPFAGGASLAEDELRERLARVAGEEAARSLPLEDFLEPAAPRQILGRLLRNLKSIYLEAGERERALAVLNRLVILLPDAAEERRDRGRLFLELECPRAAQEDLGFYMSRRPNAQDADAVAAELASCAIAAARLN
ncbi:MAG: tetratricopeptide repeat protein [Burkholderiales bacterium]|nr:tetratricopeptide repeat protein [Burkholderiales bacterium]